MSVLNQIVVDGIVYQIQDSNAVPIERTINNKQLSDNIELNYGDIGILLITKSEIDDIVDS